MLPRTSKRPGEKTIFELFDSFVVIEQKLELGEFVDSSELAEALRSIPDQALPAPIREYVIRWMEGKVKRPRGRKPKGMTKEVRDAFAWMLYRKYLAALQRQEKKHRKIRGPDKPDKKPRQAVRSGKQGRPPHLQAAERVARELFPNHTAAYVLNLVSRRG